MIEKLLAPAAGGLGRVDMIIEEIEALLPRSKAGTGNARTTEAVVPLSFIREVSKGLPIREAFFIPRALGSSTAHFGVRLVLSKPKGGSPLS